MDENIAIIVQTALEAQSTINILEEERNALRNQVSRLTDVLNKKDIKRLETEEELMFLGKKYLINKCFYFQSYKVKDGMKYEDFINAVLISDWANFCPCISKSDLFKVLENDLKIEYASYLEKQNKEEE